MGHESFSELRRLGFGEIIGEAGVLISNVDGSVTSSGVIVDSCFETLEGERINESALQSTTNVEL